MGICIPRGWAREESCNSLFVIWSSCSSTDSRVTRHKLIEKLTHDPSSSEGIWLVLGNSTHFVARRVDNNYCSFGQTASKVPIGLLYECTHGRGLLSKTRGIRDPTREEQTSPNLLTQIGFGRVSLTTVHSVIPAALCP